MKRIKDNWDLRIRGIVYLDSDLNRLQMFANESLDHWTTKALVFYHLRHLKHMVVTEFIIPGMGQGDILDLTTSIQYEIETVNNKNIHRQRAAQYKRLGVDVIVVPTSHLPRDLRQRYHAIKEYVWPD